MWAAICVPLAIGAIALVLQWMESLLDRSRAELGMRVHAAKPRLPDGSVCPPPVDFDRAHALGITACGSVCEALPCHRSVSR